MHTVFPLDHSSSNAYIVRALARRAGFPEERVRIELQTQGGRYTDQVVDPAPITVLNFLDTVTAAPFLPSVIL